MQGAQLESRLKWEVGNTYKKKKKNLQKKKKGKRHRKVQSQKGRLMQGVGF